MFNFIKNIVTNNEIKLEKIPYTVKFYTKSIRDLIDTDIIIWGGQRNIDIKHINKLYDSLREYKTLMGNFKIIKDKKDKYALIDGQHRLETIKKYINEEDKDYNDIVLIEEYEVDDINGEQSNLLFTMANNVLNIKLNDLPNTLVSIIVNKLKIKFPLLFKEITIKNKRVNRPKIGLQNFILELKKLLDIYKNINTEIIYNNIIDYDNKLKKEMDFEVSKSLIFKANEIKCYLGLIPNLDWLISCVSKDI